MNERENRLRAIRFENPEWIPMQVSVNASCWHHYEHEQLRELMAAHPRLFPDFNAEEMEEPELLLNQRASTPYRDPWGCVWETTDDGITGAVHGHPLEDWEDFANYRAPDPVATDGTYPVDWRELRAQVAEMKARGEFVWGSLPHGHTFLRLQDIRGYENLTYDFEDEALQLRALIEMVETFNRGVVDRWLELEPDMMGYPEDLGMQVGPMLSPGHFLKFILPVYERLMRPAIDSGVIIHMHCDGDIRLLAEYLLKCGVDVLNLQDLVNGIDWIAENLVGRVCLQVDVDRQSVTVEGEPRDIEELIRTEVVRLGSSRGGLMLIYGLYPGTPIKNVAAVMDCMERYMGHYN